MLVLKCGAGEGWWRTVGPIMREIKTDYKESRKWEIPYKQ